MKIFSKVLFSASLFYFSGATAQTCGTEIPSQQWETEFQKLITKSFPTEASRQQSGVYTIPVIIHVIHGGQAVGTYPNLTQGQLMSQIKVLNDDYAGIGFNTGNYPAQAFANWAAANPQVVPASLDALGRVGIANCGVQFCLATKDTLGNTLPEPGIDRVNYVTRGWNNPATQTTYNAFKTLIDNTIKPQTIWNVSKYLNIWVTDENLGAIGLLGYATFPPLTGLQGLTGSYGTATTDGFWCYARSFGSVDQYPNGFYTTGNNRGRTSTHEIGHYLGLRHIWGDGTCASDYCNDTPPASDKNFGTPSYPFKIASCSTNAPDGEMFMNFMDYTDDPIKYMFTTDQSVRIQTAMSNSPYRKFMGTHNLCNVQQYSAMAAFAAPLSVCGTSAVITLSNQSSGTPVPSFTWNVTGGAFLALGANSPIAALNFPSAGIYTVTLVADNGTLSTSQKVINVYVPTVTITGASPFECEGKDVVLTASGGNYYTWSPSSLVSPTIALTVSGISTYTIVSFGAGNCKTSTVVTVEASDCSGLSETAAQFGSFSIQPNPTASLTRLQMPVNTGSIKITDVAGKIILSAEVTNQNYLDLDLSTLSTGMYFVKWTASTGETSTQRLIKN
jgi:hypothetical protein